MANPKPQPDLLPAPPDLYPLEEYRLIHDLSYRELKNQIHKITQYHRSEDNWRQICIKAITPTKRTQFAIDLFLDVKYGRVDPPAFSEPDKPGAIATSDVLRKRQYLTTEEFMAYLGLSRTEAYGFLRRHKDIRRFRAGRGYRIFRADVDDKVNELAQKVAKKERRAS